jgi:dihydropteroate synthase
VAVWGILNVTPDSFSDGGQYLAPDAAVARAEQMVAEGADVIDLGGESTRPGASPVSEREELARVLPVLRRLRARLTVPISIDTYKAPVARVALAEGAAIINDISAGCFDDRMLGVAAASGVPIVLMHMQGTPASMQHTATYPDDDVVAAVTAFLDTRIAAARDAGVAAEHIILDPGIGFGKTTEHNLALIDQLDAIAALGHPVLIGPSRKRFLGAVTGADPGQRLEATAAAIAIGIDRGATHVRVHDVGPMVRVARMAEAFSRRRHRGGAGEP